jgi:glycogen debranching enzyme
MVVDKVFEKLYTPYGLRSLDKDDPDFKPFYGGSHFNRDMAYHQGTVWGFPLGGYYLAYLKTNEDSPAAVSKVKEQLMAIEACMREGCIGHIAELYDGENPGISKGCFAQAWSVSEILRVYAKLEKL